ncbi:branched-chain amino acid aminotransferase [Krasilnikovia cinnamomea]|uniref:Branched-chain-amino-acid aminotransferase n=2 Tax=Krasilnikovia cinnamomea TaxID=349313 RepID=A0A4Q7ZR56_9ACTN|nr:branched-chain amino acid aminotransferase [Krasilnikovia cinnamomea]
MPVNPRIDDNRRLEEPAGPAFGQAFTEHLVSLEWTSARGWHDPGLRELHALDWHPATVGLHYGQAVFEGLKAYRLPDDGMGLFRPEAHGRRLQASARRLCLPVLPVDLFTAAVTRLVTADAHLLPDGPGLSLYLRPLLYAADESLALRPGRRCRFLVMAFVTEGFFGPDVRPIRVWVNERSARAVPGGTGAVKYAGNYATSYAAQEEANAQDCDQVVWLDALERRWIEELGAMNVFFVYGSGSDARLVTPPLDGNILPGITRDSVLTLADHLGYRTEQRRISVDEWRVGCGTGEITEVFATGTAAGVSPVGDVRSRTRDWTVGNGRPGPITTTLHRELRRIQRGQRRTPAWMHRVTEVS